MSANKKIHPFFDKTSLFSLATSGLYSQEGAEITFRRFFWGLKRKTIVSGEKCPNYGYDEETNKKLHEMLKAGG